MKGSKKYVIRGALIVIAVGFVLTLGALAAGRFDMSRLYPHPTSSGSQPPANVIPSIQNTEDETVKTPISSSPVENWEYTFATQAVEEPFTSISVDGEACSVYLIPSQDTTCQVEYPTHERMTCSVSVGQDTLRIVFRDDRPSNDTWNTPLRPLEISLYLPQSQYDTLNLKTVSGNITVPEDFSFAKAQIQTTSGKLEFSADISGDLSLETVSGDLTFTGGNPQALQVQSTSGDVHLSQVVVKDACRVDSVSGDITLQDCDAQTLALSAISGDVSASLRSDKVFSTQTVSGDMDVPSGTSGGLCKITTVSGDISCTIQ